MYELTVNHEFCAAHAIRIAGKMETVHGHNWHVRVTVSGKTLDEDGLLCDFHEVERTVEQVIQPLNNADLNTTPPFDRVNPTAEHVARHIAESVAARLGGTVQIRRVSVTEAPGCEATYIVD